MVKWGPGQNKVTSKTDQKSIEPGELKDAQQKIEYLSSLVTASKLIHTTLDLHELLSIILKIATHNTRAEAGTIYLIDEKTNEIWSKVSRSDGEIDVRLPLGTGIAGYVAQTGEIMNIQDVYSHPRFMPHFDKISGFRTRSMLCVPMRDDKDRIIGVFQIMNKKRGVFEKQDEEFLMGLSIHAALAIEKAFLHQQVVEMKKIETELKIARDIQQNLLPKEMPKIDHYDFAAINLPSEMVGGDYYDFFLNRPGRVCFTIGDVSGKGIPAALLMATLRTGMHARAMYVREAQPQNFIAGLNNLIYHSALPSQFISLFYAELLTDSGQLEFVNAGHNPPLLIQRDGTVSLLPGAGGISLGLKSQAEYQSDKVHLAAGETLVLYTDGITEAMNADLEEFGEDNLLNTVKKCRKSSAREMLETIVRKVCTHTQQMEQNDDITLLIIKHKN